MFTPRSVCGPRATSFDHPWRRYGKCHYQFLGSYEEPDYAVRDLYVMNKMDDENYWLGWVFNVDKAQNYDLSNLTQKLGELDAWRRCLEAGKDYVRQNWWSILNREPFGDIIS